METMDPIRTMETNEAMHLLDTRTAPYTPGVSPAPTMGGGVPDTSLLARENASHNEVRAELVNAQAETKQRQAQDQTRKRLLLMGEVVAAVVLPIMVTVARNWFLRTRARHDLRARQHTSRQQASHWVRR